MSTATVTPAAAGPADALAASQRVQQLQGMIAKAEQGTSATSFAAALDAAQANPQAAASTTAPTTASAAAYTGLPSTTVPAAAALGSAGAPTPLTTTGTGGAGSQYDPLIAQAAARYGLDRALLHGLIQQESGFDANSRSSAGALGLTQLMPGTAASLGVSEPLNPAQSIDGGARYLSGLMRQFGGNAEDALAAYNAGPGAVQKYGGVPPYAETQDYVSKVLGYANAYRQSTTAPAATGSIA